MLDPFGGAGTTALVADRLKRNAILIELNPAYVEMARARIQSDAPLFVDLTNSAIPESAETAAAGERSECDSEGQREPSRHDDDRVAVEAEQMRAPAEAPSDTPGREQFLPGIRHDDDYPIPAFLRRPLVRESEAA